MKVLSLNEIFQIIAYDTKLVVFYNPFVLFLARMYGEGKMVFFWWNRAVEPVAIGTPWIIALVKINGYPTIFCIGFGHIQIPASTVC